MRSRENGYFRGSSQSFRNLQGRTVRPGKYGNDTPIVPSASWRAVEDRHPKRSLCVSSKAGNQSFDCWNVWRSMLRMENLVGISKLYLFAARRHTPKL